MARVVLKYNWFGPNGARYRRSTLPQEIPDEVCFSPDGTRLLPESAVIVTDDTPVVAEKEEQTAVLRNFDEVRAAADAVDKVESKAEQFRKRLAAEKKNKKE